MPRPQFGKLSKVWSDDPGAAKLISDHMALAVGLARRMERIYFGEDWETAYVEALYDAAFTWRPGNGSFESWLWLKCRDRNRILKYRFMRWATNFRRYPASIIDDRLSYSES